MTIGTGALELAALDLFAGTGWGVALQQRGIREGGVEIMDEAVASRTAAGMESPFRDVWDVLLSAPTDSPWFKAALSIASPPCQSFSVAGKGAGRAALGDVLRAIDEHAYRTPEKLRALGAQTDERTALVLTPLAQVSVWTGIMRAEQYGVPQARRRAVLIARADGIEAAMPTPTHSRFYERQPDRLDPGVLPWVSMAAALGWGLSQRPSPTITGGGTETGGAEPIAKLARYTSRPDWVFRRPATTVVADPRLGGPGRSEFVRGGVSRQNRPGSLRLEAHEAATLQTYPRGFHFGGGSGKQFLQIGNAVPPLMGGAIVDELVAPAAARSAAA
ncbi:DNA cytosine methyltransferase [Microbacterium arborescens]|uniref:DNA cytosine methyltransferase n=1 Tax=Microbacterium arborescens TaxID=33883 RepID=UPI00277D4364|nr:DNA cytosine methyltransferase [Microbacterium arborescens]MDQ1215716.1 site-specific DNA-cytosine methylase [Microbacterium arborescens]